MADVLLLTDIADATLISNSFNQFKQNLSHVLGITTATDQATHIRNLHRADKIRDKTVWKKYTFNPKKHKASFIEDEFEEFR